MSIGSIRDRRKLASNLRAAPAWLSPRRVEGIIGLLDAMRDRTVQVVTFAPSPDDTERLLAAIASIDCVDLSGIVVQPTIVAAPLPKHRQPRAPRAAVAAKITPKTAGEITDEDAAARADQPVVADRGDRLGRDPDAGAAVALSEIDEFNTRPAGEDRFVHNEREREASGSDSLSRPEGGSDDASHPVACEPLESVATIDRSRAPEPASARVAPAPVSGVDRLKAAHAAVRDRAPAAPSRPYRRAALESQQPWLGVSVVKSTSVPAPIRATVHGMPEGKTAIVSWVERQVEQVRAAIAFLRGKGFSVERADESSLIARYWVSGYRGEFSAKQVLAFAASQGFAA